MNVYLDSKVWEQAFLRKTGRMILLFYLLINTLTAFGQNKEVQVQKLITQLDEQVESVQQVQVLNGLGNLLKDIEPKKSKIYAEKAKKMAEGIAYHQGLGDAYVILGYLQARYFNRADKAFGYHQQAYTIYKNIYARHQLTKQEVYNQVIKKIITTYEYILNKKTHKRRDKKALTNYQALYGEITQQVLENENRLTKTQNTSSSAVQQSSNNHKSAEQRAVQQRKYQALKNYVYQLEAQLQRNGINYEEAKEKYEKETNRDKSRIDKLNVMILEKDSLSKQKLALVEAEKQQVETAKEMIGMQYRQNILIFTIIVLALTSAVFFFYRHAYFVKKQKRFIENKNIELGEAYREIRTKSDELELAYVQITDSIRYAQRIQEAILPEERNILRLFKDHFILYKPKEIVSGDFYWVSRVEDKILAVAADCTGHGVPGAFMSMIGNILLNKLINEQKITNPATILTQLDQGICEALKQYQHANDDGIDLALCTFEKADEDGVKVVFSGAKRPMYFFESAESQELIELRGTRRCVGGLYSTKKQKPFENQVIYLKKGGSVYLATDGWADQHNTERKKLGTPYLKRLIAENKHFCFAQQKQIIENVFLEHKQENIQRDDITVIGLQV